MTLTMTDSQRFASSFGPTKLWTQLLRHRILAFVFAWLFNLE